MGIRAAIAGASGYAGGELLRLLTDHPEIEPAVLAAGSHAGHYVGDVHPHLPSLAGERFVPMTALGDVDVVFLAMPHGAAPEVDAPLVVDLAQDHRGDWPYGLPETHRAALLGASRIAVPGCYPTAVTLALAPLIPYISDVVVVASSGTSGAGRTPSFGASDAMGDLSAYKVGVHQHGPEIERNLGLPVSFTAVLAPMPRGILAVCTARTDAPYEQLREALAYEGEPFVHLLPEGRWPHTAATLGSNSCHLQLTVDRDRVVVVSAIDNLVKGAAGQAIQAANVALGLPETLGLSANGVAP